MKSTIFVSTFLILCLQQTIFGATLSEVQLRLGGEGNFLANQISSTKASIAQNIVNTKSTLNSKAEEIKSNIKKGDPNCFRWEEQIVSIQTHQINFMYQFQPCEKNFEFIRLNGNTKSSLQTLERTVKNLASICRITNCQSQINSVASSLDVIHLNIVNETAKLKSESDTCVSTRGGNADKALESARTYWQQCK